MTEASVQSPPFPGEKKGQVRTTLVNKKNTRKNQTKNGSLEVTKPVESILTQSIIAPNLSNTKDKSFSNNDSKLNDSEIIETKKMQIQTNTFLPGDTQDLHNTRFHTNNSSLEELSNSLKDVIISQDCSASENNIDSSEIYEPKKGVVYLSRVPPYMGVGKLRDYMSAFGEVGRIYLTPEDPVNRKKRLLSGGSKKELFLEGWIEFEKKKAAKFVGTFLNNTPVGGRKRHNFWRDDIWNLKYLPKFKWHHLLEHQTEKKKIREEKRNAELLQIKRENAHYLDQVERKRKLETITASRLKKKLKRMEASV